MRKRCGAIWAAVLAASLGAAERAPAGTAARRADSAYVMADFEGPDPLTTPLKGYWFFGDDRYTPTANDMIPGNSEIISFDFQGKPRLDSSGGFDTASFPAGRGGGKGTRSMRVAYVLGNRMLSCGGPCRFDPFIAFGLVFTTWSGTLDLSGATSISFWARSDSDTVRFDAAVATDDTTRDAADYAQAFAVGPEWTRCVIDLKPSDLFKQPEGSAAKPFDPSRAYGLNFTVNRGANASDPANALILDDVGVAGWAYRGTIPDAMWKPGASPRESPRNRSRRAERQGRAAFRDDVRGLGIDLNGRALPSR
jgi:hypothetical protein